MSYYRPNFSQTAAMSRGRGYSSSRGSSYRGSSRGTSAWGSSQRGSYNNSRGSGSGARFSSSSFNSSFDSRSKYGSSSDRYSRPDDYRKSSYRPDSSRYSGSEHRGSPDRKRLRTESLSSRHDGYGGSGDSYGRYDSSGSASYTDRRSFSTDRRQSSFSRREEFRKPAPPVSSSPRGGYRGRISSRGSMRSRLRERPTRRRLIESSYVVRRRTIRPSDYTKRLKMARMRSAVVRRSIKKPKSDDESGNEKEEESEEKKSKPEAEDAEEEKPGNDGGEDDDEDDRQSEKKEKTPSKKIKDEKDEKKDSDSGDKSPSQRKYIKLVCPHCQTKCTTFVKYSLHLQSGRHISAMRRVALKQKAILSRMRLMQRNAQRELEKTTDDLASRTSFCPLCKLNYKQPKLTHQASESHKNMKKFLMPYCKTCKITFKSPMLYESHCCSIDHIKRKSNSDDKSDKDEGSGADDNLENFMTIDSVGDMDEEREKKKEGEDTTKPKESINVGIEHVKKVEVYYCDLCSMYLPRREESEMPKKIAEHCKLRTHLRRYVSYKEDKELAKRAERLQRRETLEKEKEKEKEEIKPADDSTIKSETGGKENGEASLNEDEGDEKLWADVDKDLGIILAEAESGNKSSDEDEDDSFVGGRYDRFKTGEKNVDEKKLADDGKEDESMETEVKEEETPETEAK
ncbi:zinc finger protein on ecdysone puffs-like isoform X2 [Onthophagus taurus]|uniref:zinc finger protein on ecdysone puffs-like isoform X2 n=1 Tax=Onthophagus taurus TaxID=166361 RepID=UPI000C20A8A9|nr:zinc finger protein on ecdysone puffs-like isoform X2 [Onthophagus taurus]